MEPFAQARVHGNGDKELTTLSNKVQQTRYNERGAALACGRFNSPSKTLFVVISMTIRTANFNVNRCTYVRAFYDQTSLRCCALSIL